MLFESPINFHMSFECHSTLKSTNNDFCVRPDEEQLSFQALITVLSQFCIRKLRDR